ncbi:hypothetical protein VPH35_104396 [Triticum aestivum]
MHAWFAAFVDKRYSVVPIIGVHQCSLWWLHGFQWEVDNDMWQARVDGIKPLFEEGRIDAGKSEIDAEVWDKIALVMASQFDAPYSVPIIAPHPLILLNASLIDCHVRADDLHCPNLGLQEPASKAAKAYVEASSADKFKDPKN